MDVQSHWNKAKQLGLCYRCLGKNHKGRRCIQNSWCGIDGFQKTHNQALHGDRLINDGNVSESPMREPERSLSLVMGESDGNAQSSGTEGERRTFPEHSLTITMATTKTPQPTRHLTLCTVAQLTPLGWTCISSPELAGGNMPQTNFNMAYFVHHQDKELSSVLQKFWEVDSSGSIIESRVLKQEEGSAIKAFESSVQFKEGRYEVHMPWKPDAPELPNNFEMAVRRLKSTEKRLLKDPQLAGMYSDVISKYVQKGYVSKVTPSKTEEEAWYLSHFAIVRPEKSTTKT